MINLEGVVSIESENVVPKEIYPGIRKKLLWKDDKGFIAQILEFDEGSAFTELDVHEPSAEEIYVISGVFNDGVRDYSAGTYIHNPKGTAHIPQSKEGCVLLVIFPNE